MIRGILLAGGTASRFGAPKLLHRLPGGRCIGAQAASNLLEATGNVLAVIRPGQTELQDLLAANGCQILVAPRACDGMGASLAAAVAASADAEGWVVALADMPFIDPATIRAVRVALQFGSQLATPVFAGRRGHPVGFAAQWSGELQSLAGDRGARAILDKHAGLVTELPLLDPGVLLDIDTPSDLPAVV